MHEIIWIVGANLCFIKDLLHQTHLSWDVIYSLSSPAHFKCCFYWAFKQTIEPPIVLAWNSTPVSMILTSMFHSMKYLFRLWFHRWPSTIWHHPYMEWNCATVVVTAKWSNIQEWIQQFVPSQDISYFLYVCRDRQVEFVCLWFISCLYTTVITFSPCVVWIDT